MRLSLLLAVVLPVCMVLATPPMFNDYVLIYSGGTPISVSGGHADPCVADWDLDGLKDLLVGQYTLGKIRFYANTGSNEDPVFNSFVYLKADGSDITLPYG